MTGYKPQKKNAEDLKALAQKIDPGVTSVDPVTGECTTDNTWTAQQTQDWLSFWSGPESCEVVAV